MGVVPGFGPQRMSLAALYFVVNCSVLTRAPFFAQAGALAALVIGLQYVAQTGAAPFVYQRF